MTHPVIRAGVDTAAVSAIVSWWLGFLPVALGLAATTASLIYYCMSIYYLRKNK